MTETEHTTGRTGKVEKLLRKYDIRAVGDELVERWTVKDERERQGLRAIARFFNVKIAEVALRNAGVETLEGEAENYYELLTNEDVSSGARTRTRRHLAQENIDVDELLSDFVSRQAIHTYLRKARGVKRDEIASETTTDSVQSIVERLRLRTVRVTESKIDRLSNHDEFSIGSSHVLVDVQVYCSDCGRQYNVNDLLDRGGCDCPS